MSGGGEAAPPKTVLYAAWAPFFSGAERALVILLEHLDRRRYRPVVALGTPGELQHELTRRGIEVVLAGNDVVPLAGEADLDAELERLAAEAITCAMVGV